MPKVTEPGSCRLKPGPFAFQPFALSAPLDWGRNSRLRRDFGCLGRMPLGLYPRLSLSPSDAAFVLWAVLGWNYELACQAAGLMEASSARCCQLPRRHLVSTGQTAGSLPLQENPVTADKWPMSFNHVLLIAGLWPELSR